MEKAMFWTVPIGTIFIFHDTLYKKVGEQNAIAYAQEQSESLNPETEITPIVEAHFVVMNCVPVEETL